jgi:GT2 family glycosyltransferase
VVADVTDETGATDKNLILQSELFSPQWYIGTHELALEGDASAADHFLSQKGPNFFDPSSEFDCNYYLEIYPDVTSSGLNPLIHYLKYGCDEGRITKPRAVGLDDPRYVSDTEILATSTLFDHVWYAERYMGSPPASAEDAIEHYLASSTTVARHPSLQFDAERYWYENADVRETRQDPLLHYLRHGRSEGRRFHPCGRGLAAAADTIREVQLDIDNYSLSRSPLVSIIVTNRDGRHHLEPLFASIEAQSYKNFEIIFVDDGSIDSSAAFARSHQAIVVEAAGQGKASVGFAHANNLGLAAANGELILLQNNDTFLDPNCLERLVRRIQNDSTVGAAAPKIRFWSQFRRIRIASDSVFSVDLTKVYEKLEYKKLFVRAGEKDTARDLVKSVLTDGQYELVIDIPDSLAGFPIPSLAGGADLFIYSGHDLKREYARHLPGSGSGTTDLDISSIPSFYLINNAGGVEQGELEPGDRAFGEIDLGQYDNVEEVPYFCGCSVLLRRDALGGNALFPSRFVAYYEDSDLSVRLRRSGFKILYDGSSIVYHRHSASNIEHSAFWREHVFKNRYLFKYNHNVSRRRAIQQEFYEEIKHLVSFYGSSETLSASEREFYLRAWNIYDETVGLFSEADDNRLLETAGLRLGLYNSYWSTKGGGEAHALQIGNALKQYGRIELLTENDFDLEEISAYFGVESRRFRKRIVKSVTSEITAEYDVFINACYQSHIISRALRSFYIVSFPSRLGATRDFLRSYHFLANSKYTLSWMRTYWGRNNFRGSVIYPAVSNTFYSETEKAPTLKKKIILSVGRFTSSGHTKNQKEIAAAFRTVLEQGGDASDWRLVLIGSGNDRSYVTELRSTCSDLPCEVIVDAAFEKVVESFHEASIYVHASGLGRYESLEPELMEHFGMAVAQAIAARCVPVVYDGAGPKEIVDPISRDLTFRDVASLSEVLKRVMTADSSYLEELSAAARSSASQYSSAALEKELKALVDLD